MMFQKRSRFVELQTVSRGISVLLRLLPRLISALCHTAVAGTAVGALNLVDIDFDVSTSLLGLQGLNARPATVSDLDVFHGYPDYLQINVNAHLYNPSNITIGTGDVAFGLIFNSEQIGTADIDNLVLVPGENNVPTAVHYQPSGGAAQAAGQLLLENYIQSVNSSTIIQGTDDTTPIASLKQALKTIQLNTIIPAYTQNLITQAALSFPIDIGTTSIANAIVTLQNPFTATINLLEVVANATYQGIYLGQVNVRLLFSSQRFGNSRSDHRRNPSMLTAKSQPRLQYRRKDHRVFSDSWVRRNANMFARSRLTRFHLSQFRPRHGSQEPDPLP